MVAVILGIYAFGPAENQVAICIDCLVGHLGGGCTYIDKSGNVIQPSPCFPYNTNRIKYDCSDESRNVDACIEIYKPVCGNDAKTYSNSCFACMNKMVSFYLEGECSQVVDESYCNFDEDCACGIHKETSECFYGNKAYVDTNQQCPDFCTGIAGNLIIKCVNNECMQVSS